MERNNSLPQAEADVLALREENLRLRQKVRGLEKALASKGAATTDVFIQRLLDGPSQKELENAALELGLLGLHGEDFVVMVFIVKNFVPHPETAGNSDESPPEPAGYTVIKNIFEKSADGKYGSCLLKGVGVFPCLISIRGNCGSMDDRDAVRGEMKELARTVVSSVERKHGISLAAVISRLHSGYAEISSAYKDTQRIQEYVELLGRDDKVVHYDDISRSSSSPQPFRSVYMGKRLTNSLRAGDFETAKAVMHEIIFSEYNTYRPSIQLARYRVFGVLNVFLSSLEDLSITIDDELFEKLDPIARLSEATTIQEIYRQADRTFDLMKELQLLRKQDTPPPWLADMAEYMKQNFKDSNLNVASVARYFDVNPAYSSQLFKNFYGVSILEYLNRLRLNAASAMLGTGANLTEIAEHVGYSSPRTMRRAFKRYEGVTPSMAKALSGGSGEN